MQKNLPASFFITFYYKFIEGCADFCTTNYAIIGTSNRAIAKITIRILDILASRNHDSGVAETNIPDTETTFDWLDYH